MNYLKGKAKYLFILCLFVALPLFAQQAQKVDLVPLDNGILQTVTSVNTTTTVIPTTALDGRKAMIIKNLDNVTVYIGSGNVTSDSNSTGGFPLFQYDALQIDLGENTLIYGITAASSANVSSLEVR